MRRQPMTGRHPADMHQFLASFTASLVAALDHAREQSLADGSYTGPNARTPFLEYLLWQHPRVKRAAIMHGIERAERPRLGPGKGRKARTSAEKKS